MFSDAYYPVIFGKEFSQSQAESFLRYFDFIQTGQTCRKIARYLLSIEIAINRFQQCVNEVTHLRHRFPFRIERQIGARISIQEDKMQLLNFWFSLSQSNNDYSLAYSLLFHLELFPEVQWRQYCRYVTSTFDK